MPTMRQAFAERLKQALKATDARTVSTVRLMLAALNERDVAARGRANVEDVSEAEIQQMLQTMIKQGREAITLYDQGNRLTSRNENVTRSPSSRASCRDNSRRPRLNKRPRQPSPGQAHRASRTWARSWPRSAIAMQGLWISSAPVRLSDGSLG
jgi:YqeY-like protein